MRSLKLHTKTTLLASAIVVLVIASMLWIVSARVAEFVRQEQRELAEMQAVSLAEHLSTNQPTRDVEDLTRTARLIREGRPRLLTVRIWEQAGDEFREVTAAPGSLPATVIPEEARRALHSVATDRGTLNRSPIERDARRSAPAAGSGEKAHGVIQQDADGSLYRVFAPITDGGRTTGAVEIVERLDDTPAIAVRYRYTAIWLAVGGVALITLALSLLFRFFVDQPVSRLLEAMRRAEAGDFAGALIDSRSRRDDELGRLSAGFERMIRRVGEMTEERARQREELEARVREATCELARRNAELEAANDNLEAAGGELWETTRRLTQVERLAAAGQTAAQFAHEVGTPLNLIGGHVQLLQARFAADERAASRLATISAQIERISGIVRRMLDRTRPEATELTPLDLASLLRRTCDALAPIVEQRGVMLRTEIEDDLPPVAADADRLQQVVINLTNNALDAMPDGGSLCVAARGENTHVVVEFDDTGAGMSEDVRAHIFEPLFTTKRRGQGTGLGLVIVREVMREHGGEITVESTQGRGTRFRLVFPVTENEPVARRAHAPEANGVGAERLRHEYAVREDDSGD